MRTYSIASREDVIRDPRADDFEAFYASWYPKAVAIARRGGLPDPEAAAQECMLVFWRTDYLQRHDASMGASFDTWVGNILYRRMISMQRRELRRQTIAPMSPLGPGHDRDKGVSPHADLQERLRVASKIIREEYPEFDPLWKAVVVQVLLGKVTAGDRIDKRDFADRVGMTQKDLEAEVDRFLEVVSADHELADLLGVNRSPVSA